MSCSIEGTVSDIKYGRPLAGVEVRVINRGKRVPTGSDGRYLLGDLAPGTYKIMATSPFLSQAIEEMTLVEGENATLDFDIGEKIIVMDGVVVSATLTVKEVTAMPATVMLLTRSELDEIGVEQENPSGPDYASLKVVRGGSWASVAFMCRPAFRDALAPSSADNLTGFRVVRREK